QGAAPAFAHAGRVAAHAFDAQAALTRLGVAAGRAVGELAAALAAAAAAAAAARARQPGAIDALGIEVGADERLAAGRRDDQGSGEGVAAAHRPMLSEERT